MMPIAVIDRPGWTLRAIRSPARRAGVGRCRIDEAMAPALPGLRPPAWVFLHGPRSAPVVTELRSHDANFC